MIDQLPTEVQWLVWSYCGLKSVARAATTNSALRVTAFAYLRVQWTAHASIPIDCVALDNGGRGVVAFLRWWRAIVGESEDRASATLVVESIDAVHRSALHAWAQRFGCASERASCVAFCQQTAMRCNNCKHWGSAAQMARADDNGDGRIYGYDIVCPRCDEWMCSIDCDDWWKRGEPYNTDAHRLKSRATHNAVAITARPCDMPASVGAALAGRCRPSGRHRYAEHYYAASDAERTDTEIENEIVVAFDRGECLHPHTFEACVGSAIAVLRAPHVEGLRHTPRISKDELVTAFFADSREWVLAPERYTRAAIITERFAVWSRNHSPDGRAEWFTRPVKNILSDYHCVVMKETRLWCGKPLKTRYAIGIGIASDHAPDLCPASDTMSELH